MKTLWINPFQRIAGIQALLVGGLVCLAQVLESYFFQTRFDGVLDIHFGVVSTIGSAISEMIISVLSISLIFGLCGKLLISKKMRWVDLLGTITFARIPLLIIPFFNLTGYFSTLSSKMESGVKKGTVPSLVSTEIVWLTIIGLVSTLVLIWYVTWLFQALKTSTNGKGIKFTIIFIGCLILAEMLSKFLLFIL